MRNLQRAFSAQHGVRWVSPTRGRRGFLEIKANRKNNLEWEGLYQGLFFNHHSRMRNLQRAFSAQHGVRWVSPTRGRRGFLEIKANRKNNLEWEGLYQGLSRSFYAAIIFFVYFYTIRRFLKFSWLIKLVRRWLKGVH